MGFENKLLIYDRLENCNLWKSFSTHLFCTQGCWNIHFVCVCVCPPYFS